METAERSGTYAAALLGGGCRNVELFKKVNRIGEGTYGIVYQAIDTTTNEVVALKRVRMDHGTEGLTITAIREIKLLKEVSHPNIVRLREVVVGQNDFKGVFLCFEYVEHDLAGLMENMSKPFLQSEVKCLMRQLLEALAYLHAHWIVHRDIKLSNLLYANDGALKLADFGLARTYSYPAVAMTPKVVTLWYRAPELLLGAKTYSPAIDLWAAGCIFGELLLHRVLFPGDSVKDQLDRYYELLGTPNDSIWDGYSRLPNSTLSLRNQRYNTIRDVFDVNVVSDLGVDLLKGLLTYDPDKRLSAREALSHPYFEERPYPKDPAAMPTFLSQHNGFRTKKRSRDSSPEPDDRVNVDPLDARFSQVFGRSRGGGLSAGATSSVSGGGGQPNAKRQRRV